MKILLIGAAAAICYLLELFIYSRYWNKNLHIKVGFSDICGVEGDRMVLTEVVENRRPIPLFMLKIKFSISKQLHFYDMDNASVSDNYYRNDILSVMMYQRITRELPFLLSRRGYYTIKQITMVGTDLFMTREYVSGIECSQSLTVYPRSCECAELDTAFRKMLGTVLTKRYINEDPFEFRGIREYQSYDSLKAVNWKATAKTGELKVNVKDYTSSRQVVIFLNLEDEFYAGYDNLKEESIRIAATLADRFLDQGIPAALHTNARDCLEGTVTRVPCGSGRYHMRTIKEALARLDLTKEILPFLECCKKELEEEDSYNYMIFISTFKHPPMMDKLMELQQKGKDFLWICPLEKNMEFVPPDELAECFQRVDYMER